VQAKYYRYPWEAKRERALFRGRPNSWSRSRYALARFAFEGPEVYRRLLDVGMVWYMAEHDYFVRQNRSARPLPLLGEINASAHLRYKYLLNLDGHSYAHRLLKLLATNSVVVKEQSDEVEFYYHLLRPYVHYVPFQIEVDLSNYVLSRVRTNITEAIEWAIAHDAEAKKIAAQAQALVHTHLCAAARRCYLLKLLRRYGRAMAYRPSPAYRPHAHRVEHPSELRSIGVKRQA